MFFLCFTLNAVVAIDYVVAKLGFLFNIVVWNEEFLVALCFFAFTIFAMPYIVSNIHDTLAERNQGIKNKFEVILNLKNVNGKNRSIVISKKKEEEVVFFFLIQSLSKALTTLEKEGSKNLPLLARADCKQILKSFENLKSIASTKMQSSFVDSIKV